MYSVRLGELICCDQRPGTFLWRPPMILFQLARNVLCCRAEIVGEKTFGKGVVQYYFPMADGSGIKLTIAKYLTPGHFDITESGGLKPDHACSDFPHGDRVTPENDNCILSALQLIGQPPSP